MTAFPENTGRPGAFATAMHFLLVAAMTWFIHRHALDRWWCCDDTQILKHAALYSPLQYFFVPEAWRALNIASLTPWLTLAYDVDLALFGFAPRWFYAHNLMVVGGCAWLIHLLVRRQVGAGWGLAGAGLFLVGSPIVTTAQQLMTRQYAEGLLFYLLALWLALRAMTDACKYRGALAGIAFAVAASAKEVFLPLGLVPFLLPIGTWRQRLSVAWPILAVMALYVPWRWHMLGDMVGGYTPHQAFSAGDFAAALSALSAVPRILWTHPNTALAACGGLILLAAWRCGRRFPFFVGRIVALLALLLLPLLPLLPLFSGLAEARFYIAAWAALSLIAALSAGILSGGLAGFKKAAMLCAGAILLLAIAQPAWKAARGTLKANETHHAAYRAHGQALADPDDSIILYASPDVAPWYLSGMIDLRSAMGIVAPPPGIVFDESQLADDPPGARRVLRYSSASRAMADSVPRPPELLAQWRERLRSADLSIRLEYNPQMPAIRWDGTSHGVGNTMILIAPEGAYPIGLRGSLRVPRNPFASCVRVRFDVGGGIAYTPALEFPRTPDADGIYRLAWTGRSDMFDGPSPPSRCLPGQRHE